MWPTDFPADCPPSGASHPNENHYRIIKNDPPMSDDFVSLYHQNQILAQRRINTGRVNQCETMGLSTYTDIGDAVACFHQFPNLGDKIARLTLDQRAGKVQRTPRDAGESHHTWWMSQCFAPTAFARVVAYRWQV